MPLGYLNCMELIVFDVLVPDLTPINDRRYVPTFVGEHFYCESGFSGTTFHNRVVWEDPLWDGQNCVAPGNKCCEHYGWFHRIVSSSTDNIELRICTDEGMSDEDKLRRYGLGT